MLTGPAGKRARSYEREESPTSEPESGDRNPERHECDRGVDYDELAPHYDRRYRENDYSAVERTLLEFAGPDPLRVLEIGCGTGHWLEALMRLGHRVIGLDLSREMLQEARTRLPQASLARARAERLPAGSGSANRAFCLNSFHHFEGKQSFLAEARRVLVPGGGLLIIGLDPHSGLDRWWVYDYFEAARRIDRTRYPPAPKIREWMRLSGFSRCRTIEAQHFPLRFSARSALEEGRLRRDSTSQLAILSPGEYERGIARLRSDLEAAEGRGEELILTADLRLYATTGWGPDCSPPQIR